MTKTLDTLVQDIYTTLEQGVDVSVQEALDEVGSLVREAAETVLREESVQVHPTTTLSNRKARPSNLYGVQGEEGEL